MGLVTVGNAPPVWRSVLRIGVPIGILRSALASIGWYVTEHTGGPFQVPGFALAMMAWPEAALLPRTRVHAAPPEFYAYLWVLLIVTTSLFVAVTISLSRTRRAS